MYWAGEGAERVLERAGARYPGLVEVVRTSLPGPRPASPRLRHAFLAARPNYRRRLEMIALNDCFLKQAGRTRRAVAAQSSRRIMLYVKSEQSRRYIVPLDIDELIIPSEPGVRKFRIISFN